MCAVIGVSLKQPTNADFTTLKRVFIESQIRGKHATGLAYVAQGQVHVVKHPVPAEDFPFDFPSYVNEDGNLYMIGHCRYSTSDLEFNQPIGNAKMAIVHNGVISQELPENWSNMYGYHCDTRNDSELLFRSLEKNGNEFKTEFPDASISVIRLIARNKSVTAIRNGKRPLWTCDTDSATWYVSTEDIARRSGLTVYKTHSYAVNDLQP